jgi:hypothetical protein
MSEEHITTSFDKSTIRRVWDEESQQWYFAIVDIIQTLTETPEPSKYWYKMRKREKELELSPDWRKFSMKSLNNNRSYQTDCATVQGIFRIIQSIPSPKAEPFKQWLAKVGYERLQEIDEPALAAQRARELYRAKGYSDEWIDSRLQSIDIRNELTNEWSQRDVKEGLEYAILTAEISQGTFGVKPGEHKELKGLKRQSLRDHMSRAELVFTMLGELSTTEIAREDDAQGFKENKMSARKGGQIAGDARRALESQTGKPVLSDANYLNLSETDLELEDGKSIDEPPF